MSSSNKGKSKKQSFKDKEYMKSVFIFLSLATIILVIYLSSITRAFDFGELLLRDKTLKNTDTFFDIMRNMKAPHRILTNLSYLLNYYTFSNTHILYYLFNIMLHMVNSFLVFIISFKILTLNVFSGTDIEMKEEGEFINITIGDDELGIGEQVFKENARKTAFIAAGLFAMHPIALYATAYIADRATLLSSLFILLSMTMFINYTAAKSEESEKRNLLLCVAFGVGAALCKETAALLPLLFFAFELILFDMKKDTFLKRATIYLVLFFLFEVVFLSLPSVFAVPENVNGDFSALTMLLTQPRVVLFYLSLIIFPTNNRLSIEYDFIDSTSLFAPVTTILSILLIAALIAFIALRRKKNPLISFLSFWFLISVITESIPPYEAASLKRVYLASYPIIFAFSYLMNEVIKRIKKRTGSIGKSSDYISFLVITAVALPLSFVTIKENRVFRSRVSLYKDALITAPDKESVLFKLGDACFDIEEYDDAKERYSKIVKRNENNIKAHLKLGDTYFKLLGYSNAEDHYKKAKEIDGDNVGPYFKLAKLYLKVGRNNFAKKELKKANMLQPDHFDVIDTMADLYINQGDMKKALYFSLKAADMAPDTPDLHYRNAKIYESIQEYKKALGEYEKVLELDFDHPSKEEIKAKIKMLIKLY